LSPIRDRTRSTTAFGLGSPSQHLQCLAELPCSGERGRHCWASSSVGGAGHFRVLPISRIRRRNVLSDEARSSSAGGGAVAYHRAEYRYARLANVSSLIERFGK
jgi:hypothetical protein